MTHCEKCAHFDSMQKSCEMRSGKLQESYWRCPRMACPDYCVASAAKTDDKPRIRALPPSKPAAGTQISFL